jgi:hypothetical protein
MGELPALGGRLVAIWQAKAHLTEGLAYAALLQPAGSPFTYKAAPTWGNTRAPASTSFPQAAHCPGCSASSHTAVGRGCLDLGICFLRLCVSQESQTLELKGVVTCSITLYM